MLQSNARCLNIAATLMGASSVARSAISLGIAPRATVEVAEAVTVEDTAEEGILEEGAVEEAEVCSPAPLNAHPTTFPLRVCSSLMCRSL